MSATTHNLIRWNALLLQGSRSRQEDAIRVDLPSHNFLAFALADGLGGHSCGNDASRCAVETSVAMLIERKPIGPPDDSEWRSLFRDVHDAVRNIPDNWEGFGHPAATLIAGQLTRDGHCSIAAVGDSSAWLVDASSAATRLMGKYGSGHLVAASVGDYIAGGEAVAIVSRILGPGDRLILASDGIESLSEAEIHELIRLPFEQIVPGIATAITRAAKSNQDNVALLVIELLGCDED